MPFDLNMSFPPCSLSNRTTASFTTKTFCTQSLQAQNKPLYNVIYLHVQLDLPSYLHVQLNLPSYLHVQLDLPSYLHVQLDLPSYLYVQLDLPSYLHVTFPSYLHGELDLPSYLHVQLDLPSYLDVELDLSSHLDIELDLPSYLLTLQGELDLPRYLHVTLPSYLHCFHDAGAAGDDVLHDEAGIPAGEVTLDQLLGAVALRLLPPDQHRYIVVRADYLLKTVRHASLNVP